jgi:hypothetical protein
MSENFMTAMRCACPKCQMPLQIAQALPVRVKCPRCETIFTVANPGAPAGSTPAPRPSASGIRPQSSRASAVLPAPTKTAPQLVPAPQTEDHLIVPRRRHSNSLAVFLISGVAVVLLGGVITAVLVMRSGRAEDTTAHLANLPPAQRDKTRLAVENGVSYLRAQLLDTQQAYHYDTQPGSHVGVVALAGLTLLECGAAHDDAAVEKALATVRRESARLTHTYALALSILFLDRLQQAREPKTDPKDRELIQHIAVQMVAGQNVNGGWYYHCPVLPSADAQRFLKDLKNGKPIPQVERRRDDNSINQFATLGLWAARRHDVKTDAVLLKIDKRYRDNQNQDGSWGYVARDDDGKLKDATTCAGLIGLAVGQVIRNEAAAKSKTAKPQAEATKDPATAKALEYLGKALARTAKLAEPERKKRQQYAEEMLSLHERWHKANPAEKAAIGKALGKLEDPPSRLKGTYIDADAWGDLYFLWSVERVGMIYDLSILGSRDWYSWGVEIILANQLPDGSWRDRFPGVPDTCFALLFLKRVNVAKDLTDKLKNLGRPTIARKD